MARNKGGTDLLKKQIATLNSVKNTLPTKVGNVCETFFRQSFRKQGWDDQNLQRWKARRGEVTGGIAQIARRSSGSRAILTQTGALRRSIHTAMATWKKVVIESDLPYSAIHNYGGKGVAFGKHSFRMPQRKFMGNSYNLRKKITQTMETQLNRVFK